MRDNSVTLACVGGTQSIYKHKFHQTHNQDFEAYSLPTPPPLLINGPFLLPSPPPSGLGHLTTLLPSLWWGKPITLLRRLLLSLMMLRRAKENAGHVSFLGVRRVRNREREKWTTYCGCHVSGAGSVLRRRTRPSFLNSNERGKGPKKRWEDLVCAGHAGRLEKTE